MKRIAFVLVLFVAIPSVAQTVTLTITPDKQTYQVGETITLTVLGDPEGAQAGIVFGRILFDASLANYTSSHQETLVTFGVPWALMPLTGGVGFGDAFAQFISGNDFPVDEPLSATMTLVATAPGTLTFAWETGGPDPNFHLDFFGLTSAPGGSVTIVPEPVTGALVVLGLVVTSLTRRRKGSISHRARLVRAGSQR